MGMTGAEMRAAMIQAGAPLDVVQDWEAQQRKSMLEAGAPQEVIDKDFGTAPYDTSRLSEYFHGTWKKVFGDEHSPTFKQAAEAGLQMSVTGLAVRGKMPDSYLPEDTPMAQRLVSGASQLAGDIPAMVAGAVIGGGEGAAEGALEGGAIGGAGGAVAGSVVPGPGTAAGAAVGATGGAATGAVVRGSIGATAGAFALPAALRAIMIDAYTKGDIDSFPRFWEALSTTMTEGFKGYVVGAATGGVGAGVKAVAASRGAAGLEGAAAAEASALAASKAAPLATAAELGTMVTVGKALEGEMPEPRDFLDAALLLGAGKMATATAAKLQRLYVKTGVRPVDVIEDAKADPTIKQDILSSNVETPEAYVGLSEMHGAKLRSDKVEVEGSTAHHEARSTVLSRQEETGHEHMVVYDKAGNRYEATSNDPKNVEFTPEMVGRMLDPEESVSLHHNHPSGSSFSGADISTLAYPGVKQVVAHGSGDIYRASLTDTAAEGLHGLDPKKASALVNRAFGVVQRIARSEMQSKVNSSEIAPEEANGLYGDQVSRALQAAGLIDYTSTRPHYGFQFDVSKAVNMVHALLRPYGIDLGALTQQRIEEAGRSVPHATAVTKMSEHHSFPPPERIGAEEVSRDTPSASGVPATQAGGGGGGALVPPEKDYRAAGEQHGPLSIVDDPREMTPFSGGGGRGGEPPYTDAEWSEVPKELPDPKAKAEITDPWEKVRSRIDVGNHDPKEKITLDRLYSMFIDDMHALPGKGKDAAESPYKLFRLTRGSQGRADHMLEYSRFDQKTYENTGEPLKAILYPLEQAGELDRFRTYSVARHAVDLEATAAERATQLNAAKGDANRARENAAALQAELDARKGELNKKQFRSMQDAITAWKDKAAGHDKTAAELEKKQMEENPSGVDMEAAKEVVNQGHDKYEQYMKRLVQFQNEGPLKYLRDSGVLSDAAYEAMVKAHENFVPFYRLLEPDVGSRFGTGRGLGSRNPIHRIKGSDLKIVDPLESVIKNTYTYIALADRNEAGVKLIDLLTNKREVSLLPMEKAEAPSKATGTDVSTVSRDTAAAGEAAKQIEGGPKKLEAPTEKEIVRVEEPTDTALDTNIRQALEEAGIKDVPEDLIAVLRTNTVGDGKIAVFMDGKRTVWKVDKDIETAFKAVDQETANLIIRMMAVPARMLRAGATVTPEFIGRNAVRDFMTAFINSKGIFTPLDTLGGLFHAIRKDDTYQAWLKSGGANSAMVSLDRRYLQENLFKLHEQTNFTSSARNVVKTPFAILRVMSELVENATRLGEYSKGAGEGAGRTVARGAVDVFDAAVNLGLPEKGRRISDKLLGSPEITASKSDMLDAGYASREVTLDFARMGSKMRALNMIAAFTNAQVQGVDRAIREVKARPLSFTMKAIAGITVPSVALWLANKDDERYTSVPRWEKDMFWIIPTDKWRKAEPGDSGPDYLFRNNNGAREVNVGPIYRIPKPFEIGILFGSLPERALEAFAADNPNAMKDFGKSVWGALTPNIISTWTPTAITPFLEAATNRSFFQDAPIVPAYLEKELPEYRYQPYTTEIAKKMGHVLGSIPPLKHSEAISPIMLENFVRDWTGGLGMQVLQMADKNLKMAGILPDPVRPADTLSDIPFIRAFVVRYPSGNAQEIRDFYDRHKEVSQVMATVKDLAQHGDFAAVEREMKLAPDAVMKMDGIASAISMQSKFIREVYKMPDLTPDDKRQLIDTAYFQMIAIAKQGNAMAEQAKKILNGE